MTELRTVYLAEDPLRAKVIIRVFRGAAVPDRQSFLSAAQTFVNVDHPHIVPVLETGEHDGRVFAVRRFIEGIPLADLIERGEMRTLDQLRLMRDLASALAYLHRSAIAYADVRPSTLIVDAAGGIAIVDLRIEQLAHSREPNDEDVLDPDMMRYLSPERLIGGATDLRSDIFTFGAIFYEVLTNRPAFPGDDAAQVLRRIRSAPPLLVQSSSIGDTRIAVLVERCLQKDPRRRYQSFDEILALLDAITLETLRTGPERPTTHEPVRALSDNVQFTVYRRSVMAPLRWYRMLAFAHLAERRPGSTADEPDPVEEVQRQAKQALGEEAADFQRVAQDSSRPIPERGHLRFVPDVEGIEFNPPERSFLWTESVHREEFHLMASPALDGEVARGVVAVYLGRLMVAEIAVAIRIDSAAAEGEPMADGARPYRRIFASYSHHDTAIVEEVEGYAESLGDEYLRDATQLRSGEQWGQRLAEMIASADIFQLFWSWNALQSPFVRAEWEHALALRRGHFIRPVYWEEPFPSTNDLPPPSLRALHFTRIQARSRGMPEPSFDVSNPFDLDDPFSPPNAPSRHDPLELLDIAAPPAPKRASKAKDLDPDLPLDAPFKPPAVVLPRSGAALPSGVMPDATMIPADYDPLAPDEPSSFTPAIPRPAAPAAPAASQPGLTDLAAVLDGAGLDPASVTPEFARELGRILRVVVSGMMELVRSRQAIEDEFRMSGTRFKSATNNPLEFSANVDDALDNLFVKRNPAYLHSVDAFEDAFDDWRRHHIAMVAAIRAAFASMLADFDPDRLQEDCDRAGMGLVPTKLHYWRFYRERYQGIIKDPDATFLRLFGEVFARAHEEQFNRLKRR